MVQTLSACDPSSAIRDDSTGKDSTPTYIHFPLLASGWVSDLIGFLIYKLGVPQQFIDRMVQQSWKFLK